MKPMRHLSVSLLLIACLSAPSSAAIVELDFAAASATSDTRAVEVGDTRVADGQIGVFIQNTTSDPQSLTLKVDGLKEQTYDVYVSQSYLGMRTREQLEQGLQLSIPGRVVAPEIMRCLDSLKDRIKPALKTLKEMKGKDDGESSTTSWTLGSANGLIRGAISTEKTWRSVDVIIAPERRALSEMTWRTRMDERETARNVTSSCWLIQKLRVHLRKYIKTADMRDLGIAALTPVDFSAVYSSKSGKPHVEAILVNNCNLPISGNIVYTLPKGWKTNAKNLAFKDLKSGKTFKASLDLLPMAKGAAIPESVPVAANITIADSTLVAKFMLKATGPE